MAKYFDHRFSSHLWFKTRLCNKSIRSVLFNVFIDILSNDLNNSKIGCHLGPTLINHVLYADDLVLISPSHKALQLLVNICENYGIRNDVVFSTEKTKCMIFSKRLIQNYHPINLNGQNVEFVRSITYLGVLIRDDLSDDDEIEHQSRNLCARSNTLSRTFFNCGTLIKNRLFQTYCTSIYGLGLWQFYKKKNIDDFKVCYNNAFRYLHGYVRWCSASATFVGNNTMSFIELVRKKQFTILNLALTSDNIFVQSSIKYCSNELSIVKFWIKNLYV